MINNSPTIAEIYNLLRKNPKNWYSTSSFSGRNTNTADKFKRLFDQGYVHRKQIKIRYHMVYHYRIK